MLLFLIGILIIILLIEIKQNHKELISPSVLYIVPFVAMCIIAQAYSNVWKFELHINSFFIIVIGTIGFCIGNRFGKGIRLKRVGRNNNISISRNAKSWKYILFLALQIICYLIKLRYIMSFTGTNDISKSLVIYNNLIKFTTEDRINFPGWLSLGLDICTMFGFIVACLFAQQLLLKNREKKNYILIASNFVVAVIGGSSSGGRGGSVQVLVSFICAFLILYYRKYNWKKEISGRMIVVIALSLVGVVYLFVASIEWIGRNEVHMVGRYITNYIGAQIYNFDYMMNNTFEASKIIGQETFYPLIQKICGYLGIEKWANYHVGYPNVFAAGYSTGNVYTCYYSYVKDFGVFGAFFIPLVFGLFSRIFYRYAKSSPNIYPINMGLVYYSNLAYMIAFSFFADKFGAIVLSPNMLKRVIILWIVSIFMFGFNFRKLRLEFTRSKSKNIVSIANR